MTTISGSLGSIHVRGVAGGVTGGSGYFIAGAQGSIKVRGTSGSIIGGGAERAVTARLRDHLGVLIDGALDNSYGRNFTHIGSDFGRGTCSLGREDPNVDELKRGRYVEILVGGTVRFTFKIQGAPRKTEISVGEEIRESVTVSGLGWGCVFNEAVLHPEPGVESPLDYAHRLWSFASRNFPNADAWEPVIEHYEYHEGVDVGLRVDAVVDPGTDHESTADDVLRLFPSPKDFPWPNAEKNGNGFEPTPGYDPTFWVYAFNAPSVDAIGYHFMLGGFGLAGDQEITFLVTGDNLWKFFVDGVPILENVDNTWGWRDWKPVTLVFGAGFHTVGYVVENVQGSSSNPGGGLFNVIAVAVYPGDVETTLTLSLLSSGAADLPRSWFSDDVWPGWKAGQIIPDMTDEAQAQGALALYQGGTFTAHLDTAGNAFPEIPVFAQDIGRTLGEALHSLDTEGHIDWDFHPDLTVGTLDVWVKGQAGTVTAVDFHEPTDPDDVTSGNLRELTRGEVAPYANYLLVQWSGGTTVVEDTVEQAAYGSVVQGFLRTDAGSIDEAQAKGTADLNRRKLGSQAGVTVEILPTSAADTPYEGFGMFDYVTIPNEAHDDVDSVQVLSIDLSEDAEGWAIWKLDLNERPRAPQRELLDLLRSLGGVSFGGVPGGGGVARE